jgi:hypothetical protein
MEGGEMDITGWILGAIIGMLATIAAAVIMGRRRR